MDWQTPTSLIIVVASACVLVQKLFRSATGQGGCEDCSSCAANGEGASAGAPTIVPLVQLQDSQESVD